MSNDHDSFNPKDQAYAEAAKKFADEVDRQCRGGPIADAAQLGTVLRKDESIRSLLVRRADRLRRDAARLEYLARALPESINDGPAAYALRDLLDRTER